MSSFTPYLVDEDVCEGEDFINPSTRCNTQPTNEHISGSMASEYAEVLVERCQKEPNLSEQLNGTCIDCLSSTVMDKFVLPNPHSTSPSFLNQCPCRIDEVKTETKCSDVCLPSSNGSVRECKTIVKPTDRLVSMHLRKGSCSPEVDDSVKGVDVGKCENRRKRKLVERTRETRAIKAGFMEVCRLVSKYEPISVCVKMV